MGIRTLLVSLGVVVAVAASVPLFAGGAAHGSLCGGAHCSRGSGSRPSGAKLGVTAGCDTTATPPDDPAAAYDQDANSRWARMTVNWSDYETRPPGETNAYDTDDASNLASCIETLHAAGESVLVDFVRTPCWATADWSQATDACNTSSHQEYDGGPYAHKAPNCADEACYGAAAAHLVSVDLANACGTDRATGKTSCGVQAVEVWNEESPPNSGPGYWTGTEDQYATLLQDAYQALHNHALMGTAKPPLVVVGGTSHVDYYWDHTLLEDEEPNSSRGTQFQCGGATAPYCFDVLGVHTYPWNGYPYHGKYVDIPEILNAAPTTQLACGSTADPGSLSAAAGRIDVKSRIGFPHTGGDPTSGIPSGKFTIQIGSEDMIVTGGQRTTQWRVTRGADNTTATSHPCGSDVYGFNTLDRLVADLNSRPALDADSELSGNPVPIWITEMGDSTGNLSDDQNAQMLEDFYNYIRGVTVEGNTCPATSPTDTCERVQFGMWFADYLPPTSTRSHYSMVYSDQRDPATYLTPKPVMTAFMSLR